MGSNFLIEIMQLQFEISVKIVIIVVPVDYNRYLLLIDSLLNA